MDGYENHLGGDEEEKSNMISKSISLYHIIEIVYKFVGRGMGEALRRKNGHRLAWLLIIRCKFKSDL